MKESIMKLKLFTILLLIILTSGCVIDSSSSCAEDPVIQDMESEHNGSDYETEEPEYIEPDTSSPTAENSVVEEMESEHNNCSALH